MMEAQCAIAETAIRGAEPGLAEVKNYFTCLENKNSILYLLHFLYLSFYLFRCTPQAMVLEVD